MHLDTTYGRHLLLPHPVSEPGAAQDLVQELSVAVSRTSADHLKLTFRLSADLGALKLPEPRPPVRTDGLWRHSCFEAFIGLPFAHGTEYFELHAQLPVRNG